MIDKQNSEHAVLTADQAENWHVCGVIVQFQPHKQADVEQALLAIPNTEIAGVDVEEGKMVVIMQSAYYRELVRLMEQARDIDGVITLSLVYHQDDFQQDNE